MYYYYCLESLSVLNNHIIKLSDFRIKRLNVGGKKHLCIYYRGQRKQAVNQRRKKMRLNDCLKLLHEQKSPEVFLKCRC